MKKSHLEWALDYAKMGLSIIPVGKDKKPLITSWTPYQKVQPSMEQINEWWTKFPDANIAVITGEISGILALDIDTKHNRSSEEFEIPHTACAKSGSGGEHFFFKHPNFPTRNDAGSLFGAGVDIRGNSGYIILAPSLHQSGNLYEWLVPLNEGLSEAPDWLLKPLREGKKLEPLKKIAVEGVSEGFRNTAGASFSGTLLKYFPQNEWDSTCWPLFTYWNQQNKPPLPNKELTTIFESVKKIEMGNKEKKDGNKTEKIGDPIKLTELINTQFPTPQYVIEQFFETGTINMLSAPPNRWKSWVVLLCAISVASGTKLFGKFNATQSPVLIINEEDNARLLQNRCEMLSEDHKLPIYFYISKGIRIDESTISKIIEEAKKLKIGLIIFDSLRSVHDADENSSKEMQAVMDQFKRITREGITILFTHHNRKKSQFGGKGDVGENSRGSTAINASLHGHLACDEFEKDDSKYLVITQAKLKANAKIEPFEILIKKDEEKNNISFIYAGEYIKADAMANQTKEAVNKIIEESEKWLGVKDLMSVTKSGETTIRTALKTLTAQGIIKSMSRKKISEKKYPVETTDGQHNEKLYFKTTDKKIKEPDNLPV